MNSRNKETFRHELQRLINSVSMENGSNTPDWVLADYLKSCLDNFDRAVNARETWYGRQTESVKAKDFESACNGKCCNSKYCPCDLHAEEEILGDKDDAKDVPSNEELLKYAVDLGKMIWDTITNPKSNDLGPR